ncbi:MAG TPA: hypothetical protein DCF33_05770 [Saprospirales bacterium]|nr:hypothetical protein [Saprospirales bacterium]
MGGEKSIALVEVLNPSESFEARFLPGKIYPKRNSGQVLLVSDALVDDHFWGNCIAAVAETVPFRNIITPESPRSYGPMRHSSDQQPPTGALNTLYKTGKLQLLKRGSVLYPASGNVKSITDPLNAQVQFRQIGYNHYFTF